MPEGARDIALVGDSHAEDWRAAIEVVAQAKRWRGSSITLSGCPFSTRPAQLQTPSLTRRPWVDLALDLRQDEPVRQYAAAYLGEHPGRG